MSKGKRITLAALAAIAITAFADAKPSVTVTASLKDGSTVKGELLTGKLNGSTVFSQNLALDAAIVKSINFIGTNGEAKVELVNSDRFSMTIANGSFAIRSMLGDLKIPRANFRAIFLSSVTNGGCGDGLIFHCTFDDEKSIVTPAVGPVGRFSAGGFHDGKKGRSLMAMPYTRHAAFEFPTGFLKDSGCIEFWAKFLKPTSTVGGGGDPRLLAITSADTHEVVCNIDIVSNDGSGNSGFALRTWYGCKSSINGMRYLRYDDLFSSGDWRDWHHYAVVWDKDGIPGLTGLPMAALLVDGKLITSAGFGSAPLNVVRMPSQMPHVLGITYDPAVDPERNTKSPFLIDEFKIWDYAKTDFH